MECNLIYRKNVMIGVVELVCSRLARQRGLNCKIGPSNVWHAAPECLFLLVQRIQSSTLSFDGTEIEINTKKHSTFESKAIEKTNCGSSVKGIGWNSNRVRIFSRQHGLTGDGSRYPWTLNKYRRNYSNRRAEEDVEWEGCSVPYRWVLDAHMVSRGLDVRSERREPVPVAVQAALDSIQHCPQIKEMCLHRMINEKLFDVASCEFVRVMVDGLSQDRMEQLTVLGDSDEIRQGLLPSFLQFIEDNYRFEIEEYRRVVYSRDLTKPHVWFPMARAIHRKIVYHSGPTNSGKTYNALMAMKQASSGMYCGPLRLLAMEIYEACNMEGTLCSLVTGQEKREVPGAQHTSCTVEMIDMGKQVDVAVIDEIQLLGDESRGWAWTRALLGVPASEIHVCGDGSAVNLVKWIAKELNEPFELKTYDRFTPLNIEEHGMKKGYSSVEPGDCIVAFSRNDIFGIKSLVETQTPYKACVVYGALPPETRRQQARLFNQPDSGYDIMVASDAVGMGLNLNIRRIIFHTMEKREGRFKPPKPVSVSMIKQIAGRAGRRNSNFSEGRATCFEKSDVSRLRDGLHVPLERMKTPKAGLYPEFEHFEAFAASHDVDSFSHLIKEFSEKAVLHGNYFFCRQDSTITIAQLLERVDGLSMHDMYSFCMAPASSKDLRIMASLLHFAKRYATGEACELDIDPGDVAPSTPDQMKDFEAAHQIATLWLWLSHRFDDHFFPNKEKAVAISRQICSLLDQGLANVTRSSGKTKHPDAHSRGDVATARTKGKGHSAAATAKTADLFERPTPDGKTRKASKKTKVCKNSKQLFSSYRAEFFALFNESKKGKANPRLA